MGRGRRPILLITILLAAGCGARPAALHTPLRPAHRNERRHIHAGEASIGAARAAAGRLALTATGPDGSTFTALLGVPTAAQPVQVASAYDAHAATTLVFGATLAGRAMVTVHTSRGRLRVSAHADRRYRGNTWFFATSTQAPQ